MDSHYHPFLARTLSSKRDAFLQSPVAHHLRVKLMLTA